MITQIPAKIAGWSHKLLRLDNFRLPCLNFYECEFLFCPFCSLDFGLSMNVLT